ncbi:alpha/beta hydrolase [Terrarubrum flagellatum]|uniref:alpha/beta hydrolase n=1 Tax=Terrirubrum flagellatum TaxID=2895980 RepID=UPI003144DB35
MRSDISFSSDGATLRGWLFRPEQTGKRPAIVMAHGFSATKEMGLEPFAESFCAAGFVVIVYDHRNLGASDGAPRGEIDPWAQIRGYRDAITFAQALDCVDSARIGVWGSSYSGGHVIVVAAIDRRVGCVVANAPIISGSLSLAELMPKEIGPTVRAQCDADRLARFRGEKPTMIPVVATAPGGLCALPTSDSADFFLDLARRAPNWRNEVTLRSAEMIAEYEPGDYIHRVAPTPLMITVATRDALLPTKLTLEAFDRASSPKKLLKFECGHFDAYREPLLTPNCKAQRDWFLEHLAAGHA